MEPDRCGPFCWNNLKFQTELKLEFWPGVSTLLMLLFELCLAKTSVPVSTGWSQLPEYFTPADTWGLGFGGASRQEAVGVPYLGYISARVRGWYLNTPRGVGCLEVRGRVHFTCEMMVGALVLHMMALVSGATWASHGICHWSWHLFDRKLLPAWVSSLPMHLFEKPVRFLKREIINYNLIFRPCYVLEMNCL